MRYSHTIEIHTTPQKIFSIYADVANWKNWDEDVIYATLNGVFQTDATGELKPKKGPKSTLYFTEVIPDKSFTTMGKLPFCKMYFKHTIEKLDESSSRITHSVSFEGLLSPLFGRFIGRQIDKNLPQALKNLKIKAEKGDKQSV